MKDRLIAVLLVDDDWSFRCSIRALLEKEGLQIIEAVDGIEGLEILQQTGSRIDLLLTDLNMPRMNGLSLAESAMALYPTMPVVIMTGQALQVANLLANCTVLCKPFNRQTLVEALRKSIGGTISESKTNETRARSADALPPGLVLRNHWRSRLRKAKEHHTDCSLRLQKALEEQGSMSAADGSLAIRQALIHESMALQEYRRILGIVRNLAISGKLPDEI